MVLGANFPSGCWSFDRDNGVYRQTTFRDSQIFAMGGVPVLSHEPYGSVGLFNMADYLDPTSYGDMSLMNRRTAANMDVMTGWLDNMRNAGLYSFNIDGSTAGTAPSGGPAVQGGTYTPGTYTPGTYTPGTYTPGTYTPGTFVPGTYTPGGVTNPFGPSTTPVAPNPAPSSNDNNGNDELAVPQDYASQMKARLSLIERYCDKYGKIVDVNKIRSEYANDAQGGVEFCDDILNNKFDQAKLEKMVHKEYRDYNKRKLENAAEISNEWVDTVLKGGLESLDISTAGVNKRNILDVVGTFMTNEEVKNGKVSLENVFESPEATLKLIDSLKERADELLLDEDTDEAMKDAIVEQIAVLRDNYDKYQDAVDAGLAQYKANGEFVAVRKTLTNGFIDLFKTLRLDEAEKNDEKAPQHYGLPESTTITFSDQTDRANEEIRSYGSRRRLSTHI